MNKWIILWYTYRHHKLSHSHTLLMQEPLQCKDFFSLCWSCVLDHGYPSPRVFAEALSYLSLWVLCAQHLVGPVEHLLNKWTPSHCTLLSFNTLYVTVLCSFKQRHCHFLKYICLCLSKNWHLQANWFMQKHTSIYSVNNGVYNY